MTFFDLIGLFGGLALFLYGMSGLGSGLEKLSGGRLEHTLEKLTNNILKSVLLGATVTAAVQSSSATTVIVVGLVNAKILKLKQAIGVIMGANIGTTITAHILRLSDISGDSFFLQMLKPTTLAPLVGIIGIILFMMPNKTDRKDIGQILLGFCVLFTGMFTMEAAVAPLKEVPAFAQLFQQFSNPILGVLIGAFVTAVIQSSSASVGILQALSSTGMIPYSAAVPIILGQNIGTCVTPMLASIGASRSAKRTALVHLFFNVLGSILFLAGLYTIYYTVGFSFWESPIDKGGIANFHSLFNIIITLVFIPLAGLLEKIVTTLIHPSEQELQQDDTTLLLDSRFMVSPGLAIDQARLAVARMARLAGENMNISVTQFQGYDAKKADQMRESEMAIDKLEDKLRVYLLSLTERELTDIESHRITALLQMLTEFERIGDYSINLLECAEQLKQAGATLSPTAQMEFTAISHAVGEIVLLAEQAFLHQDENIAINIEPLEQVIDLMEELLKTRHIERLKAGKCSAEVAFPFIDALSHLERIADHCSNVGVYIIGYGKDVSDFDRHEYLRKIHQGETRHYTEKYQFYTGKYLDLIKPEPQT